MLYIFDWLQLFDFNIIVILVIMIMVATINMVVALLVLDSGAHANDRNIESVRRGQWLGYGKSFFIMRFTLSFVVCFGVMLLASDLLLIQQYTGIINLNPENYYVNEAPVYLNWGYILLLNVGTVAVCLVVLLMPSYIITKISPVKAIRFD